MALERRTGDTGKIYLVLTSCPICGKSFDENGGCQRAKHFLNEHTPADFGLGDDR